MTRRIDLVVDFGNRKLEWGKIIPREWCGNDHESFASECFVHFKDLVEGDATKGGVEDASRRQYTHESTIEYLMDNIQEKVDLDGQDKGYRVVLDEKRFLRKKGIR